MNTSPILKNKTNYSHQAKKIADIRKKFQTELSYLKKAQNQLIARYIATITERKIKILQKKIKLN